MGISLNTVIKNLNKTHPVEKQSPGGVLSKRSSYKFYKIHRKIPVPESFFKNIASLRPVNLLKKRLWHRCFPVNFAKFLRTPFFIEHLEWLLLPIGQVDNTGKSKKL